MRSHRLIIPILALGALAAAPAARADVDPSTLNPPPPSIYTCHRQAGETICRAHTFSHEAPVQIEDFCGFPIFDQGDIESRFMRRYDANGNWVERTRHDVWTNSFWSSPQTTGTSPYTQQDVFLDRLGVPGDPSTITDTDIQNIKMVDGVTGRTVLRSVGYVTTAPDGTIVDYAGQLPFVHWQLTGDTSQFALVCKAISR